jgi:hypothetical protein
MKTAILNSIKTHGATWLLFAVALVGIFTYEREHDQRIAADIAVKSATAQIADLQKQSTAVAAAATRQVVVIQQAAAKVQTSQEAVSALVTDTPSNPLTGTTLAPVALPDAPDRVSVEALPLYQDAAICREDQINLGACTKETEIAKQESTAKDAEIKALKAKPSFWHRVKTTAVTVGIGVAVGTALGVAATHH